MFALELSLDHEQNQPMNKERDRAHLDYETDTRRFFVSNGRFHANKPPKGEQYVARISVQPLTCPYP